ncbi:hypothetical protein [Bdellovibrio sp. BCCA]|uniref:hypothetical protein n=1 Tax=Bdellovibrio sp. BCCA TaxID=3136281 RepID=UPI0030F1C52D
MAESHSTAKHTTIFVDFKKRSVKSTTILEHSPAAKKSKKKIDPEKQARIEAELRNDLRFIQTCLNDALRRVVKVNGATPHDLDPKTYEEIIKTQDLTLALGKMLESA